MARAGYAMTTTTKHYDYVTDRRTDGQTYNVSLAVTRCAYRMLVRPLSTVGYTSVAGSVIHSRQWSN